VYEVIERCRPNRAFFGECFHWFWMNVVYNALMPGLPKPAHHVVSHSAKADHA
jgi:hypothetical protein